ncbi:Nif3-like dinuclear metal center hexameric protein [Oceanidesulfovibrio indonesiensis]|uniref:GTP cyclohydrolase 1 type 2 homolog n=1 Tax=Oceanidesulfovibrio indonesiensis TaxID=54767 RepID=A0A7M3MGL8_9BACT|nr:Nif3-like dinuclear metal center hexameric protein [Oceanidesulfovibrio indonesiensis]TVM18399.1 Nif3-like dinuclear metal center hexameric protein [Oceanidesulfovibrio indonesiensis]
MKLNDIIRIIEETAPLAAQAPWDQSGIQIPGSADKADDVRTVAVTIDPTPAAMARCIDENADLILTHHPLAIEPKRLSDGGPYLETTRLVISSGATLYAAHTSLDANPNGPAGWLARELDLQDMTPLEITRRVHTRGAIFPVSPDDEQHVGRWKELPGVVDVQLLDDECFLLHEEDAWSAIRSVVAADLADMAAFNMVDTAMDDVLFGIGQVGSLPEPLGWNEFLERIAGSIGNALMVGKIPPHLNAPATVSRVAICPGSGSSLAGAARARRADVLITGDVKYHAALEAPLPMVDVGHFCLEEEMMRRFASLLAASLSALNPKTRVVFVPGYEPRTLLGSTSGA